MNNIKSDITIIGGGPAGIAAGIYACMDKANFYLIEKNEECCAFMEESVNSHKFVDGFTGSKENTTGTKLQKSFLDHYKRLGGKIFNEEVISLNRKNDYFTIKTNKNNIVSKAVIITCGAKPKLPEIQGQQEAKEFIYDSCVKNGKKFIGKSVIVIGARNSGVVAACYLHDLGCNVSLLEIKDSIQAKDKYLAWLKKRQGIKVFNSAKLEKLKIDRNNFVCATIKIKNDIFQILTNGIFLYSGRVPNLDFLKINIKRDNYSCVITDQHNSTSAQGLFAAGDITCKLKQVITACGDGANAYYFANKYIQNKK